MKYKADNSVDNSIKVIKVLCTFFEARVDRLPSRASSNRQYKWENKGTASVIFSWYNTWKYF